MTDISFPREVQFQLIKVNFPKLLVEHLRFWKVFKVQITQERKGLLVGKWAEKGEMSVMV